ncbi:universal stress protein [Solirhodobacter olei]|uniref:universal stress protein n=1 Tax=Solirhodobacter olei TaxID=2493082 RepID=UPI000FD95B6B|nr:universal stress protein [Solirhodobacter olei]
MKTILTATDGSEGAARALDFAISLASQSGATLHLINVVGGYGLPSDVMRQLSTPGSAWFDDALAADSAEVLHQARARATAAGLGSVILESRHGDVAASILDYARERGIEVIVVGKRGQGRVEAMLLGSVSQKLVSLADRVVVVVP